MQSYKYTEAISIDYSVLEKSKDIYVVPNNFGRDDVGSWEALDRYREKDKYGNILIKFIEWSELEMIPKVIHYVWIGGKKGSIENICINSWKEKLPEYEIIEWNESNIDIEKLIQKNKFLRECYKRKLWAFLADYIRIKVLYEYGGIYLDTDMQILKNIDDFLENEIFFGLQEEGVANAAIIGSVTKHKLLKDILEFYEEDIWKYKFYTIPSIITYIIQNKYKNEIKLYDTKYFYPFHYQEDFSYSHITKDTYSIHWWNNSWGKKRNYFLETKHLKGLKKVLKIIRVFLVNTIKRPHKK